MSDRLRWNAKYQAGSHASGEPSTLIAQLGDWLPPPGKAVDLAGGAGRHALWLARLGWTVSLVDVSDVGLQLAASQAALAGVPLTTTQLDLVQQPPPAGPWDLVLITHFLHRPLYQQLHSVLAPGGRTIILQPTQTNLRRHPRPPAEYLLADRELPALIGGLRILYYREGWLEEGRHEALLVAERSA